MHPVKSINHKDISDITLKKNTIGKSRATPVIDEKDGQRHSTSLEYTAKTVSVKLAQPVTTAPATLATLIKQIANVLLLPPTKFFHQNKIPTSLENIPSSPNLTISPPSIKITSLKTRIPKTIRIIHKFNKYQHKVSKKMDSKILQILLDALCISCKWKFHNRICIIDIYLSGIVPAASIELDVLQFISIHDRYGDPRRCIFESFVC
jgi:hypothetical protein